MAPPLVCHLIKGLGRGGAESLLPPTIASGSGELSYAVGYFLPWKDALVGELEADGVPVRCFGGRSSLAVLLRAPAVAGWLRKSGAALVHAHLPLAGVVARIAGRLAGIPVVYTGHNLLERYHPLTRWADVATWRWQALVITVSEEVATSARRHAGDKVPIEVVRNGIPVDRYRRDEAARLRARGELGIPAEAPVVGTVAVFRKQKRLDLWLEAAARVATAAPECHFLLVGDGPLAGEVRERSTRLGLDGRLHLPGLQADVVPYLSALDLYLVSSEFEGLPLALLEAMAAGLPVVSTPVGGIPEVVEHGRHGRLVPFGDVDAMSRAVLDVLGDPATLRNLGDAARRRVEEGFGVGRMAGELEGLYRRVLGGAAAVTSAQIGPRGASPGT